MICEEFENNPKRLLDATTEELNQISGIGAVIAKSFVEYFQEEEHRKLLEKLLKEVKIQQEEQSQEEKIFANLNFVITGNVEHFANRREVKEAIEIRGGKVTGSVTSKTNYLINNDIESSSSKNKKARELGIPIISENEFIEMLERK